MMKKIKKVFILLFKFVMLYLNFLYLNYASFWMSSEFFKVRPIYVKFYVIAFCVPPPPISTAAILQIQPIPTWQILYAYVGFLPKG